MTQEELDALMAGELDDLGDESSSEEESVEKSEETNSDDDSTKTDEEGIILNEGADPSDYRPDPNIAWPPPPPTDDHKMVSQLDDVTKDSEVKATQIFDKLEAINDGLMNVEEDAGEITACLDSNIELFTKLSEKFPSIEPFKKALEDNEKAKAKVEDLVEKAQMAEDEIMMAMDIMQYQDIHRQKIERVINVMRALSKYMNLLFEGSVADEKRVSSAVHIHGDSTEDVVSSEDIEALIESLGKKK